MIVGGLGLLLAGCVSQGRYSSGSRSGRHTRFPVGGSPHHSGTGRADHGSADTRGGVTSGPPVYQPGNPPTAAQPIPDAIARHHWTRVGPVSRDIYPMNGVNRITIHHEGHTQVAFADVASTQQRLEAIRRVHTAQRGWADIGYHYIIDRAGRVWCGRDVRLQGAHASRQNEHNIGIMVLGNFGLQAPTQAQVASLELATRTLMSFYRVPVSRVFTHRELPEQRTACPGDQLQAHVGWLRRSRLG